MSEASGRSPNLIVVTVDCMRRDRLSAYGYGRQTTPFLDRLTDSGIHCTSAHSVSSWTCPSVASLLTGQYPHRHGGGLVPGDLKNLSKHSLPTLLPPDVPTLPAILAERGYATAAIGAVWNAHLSIPGRFQHMAMVERPAQVLVRRALRWIRAQSGPFFLWLHLGDAHEPLRVAWSLRRVFGPVPRVPKVRRWDYTTSGSAVGSPAFLRYREARIRLYDAAVRSADAAIAALWSGLERLRDRTVWAVTSDHGEEFWEHREEEMASFTDPRDIYGTGHGHNLFQVHLLVPLLFVGPGIPAKAIEENVSLVDVFATTLLALGVDAPQGDGRPLLEGDARPRRPVISEGIAYGHEKQSVVVEDHKLLVSSGDGYEHAFRLGPDRVEAGPLEDPALVEFLRQNLPAEPARVGEQVEGTEEIEKHLRQLGYLD